MNRSVFAMFAAALMTSGYLSSLAAQEEENQQPPRLTPEERREQWRELRDLAPEERRNRFQQWRERRESAGGRRAAVEDAPGEPPERYLEQLEFRSILTLDGVTEFSLRNPFEGRTFQVSEKEGSNGIEVVEFDSEKNALTLSHEDDTETLFLQASRVGEAVDPGQQERERRRERWQARREQFREFRATWQEATEESSELGQIENQFRELVGDFRQNRREMRDTEPGSAEREQLQAQEQEMREEFRLLTEYSMLEVRKNPAFEGQDLDSLDRMMRGMMFRQGGEGRRGGRDRGNER